MKRIGRTVAVAALSVLAAGALAGCGANLDREVEVQGMLMEVPSDWLQDTGAGNNDSRGTVSFIEEEEDRDEDETGNMIEVSYRRVDNAASQAESRADASLGEDSKGQSPSSENFANAEESSDAATETDIASDGEVSSDNAAALRNSLSGNASSDTADTAGAPQTAQPEASTRDASEGAIIEDEVIGRVSDIAPAPRTAMEAMAAKQVRLEKEQGIIAWSIDEENTRVIDGAQVTSYEYSFVKEIDAERRKYEFKTVFVFTHDMMYEISIVGDAVSVDALIDTIEL